MGTNGEATRIQQVLMQHGQLVELKISSWAGKTRIEADDLGLAGVVDETLHRLGHRRLVPPEELAKVAAIAKRARVRLADASYEFPIGGGRFVPVAALGSLLADLSRIRGDFERTVAEFVAKYAELAEKTRGELMICAERIKAELAKDDDWLAAFEGRLQASYPTVAAVTGAFGMSWNLYEITLPSGVDFRQVSAADALEAGRLASEARERVEASLREFVGEANVELRRRAGEMCRRVASRIREKGGTVTERAFQPLRDLIDEFRQLDFTGDEGFATELDRLKTIWLGEDAKAGTAARVRDEVDYREHLGQALQAMGDQALQESERAAAEAMERFLKFGGAGRAVAS